MKKYYKVFRFLRKYYAVLILALVVVLGIIGFQNPRQIKITPVAAPGKEQDILYYGDGCPHCAKVEEFLKTKTLPANFNLIKKEVYNNAANASELVAVAKSCGLNGASVGIPFLYTGGKCLTGDKEIIDFFQKQ